MNGQSGHLHSCIGGLGECMTFMCVFKLQLWVYDFPHPGTSHLYGWLSAEWCTILCFHKPCCVAYTLFSHMSHLILFSKLPSSPPTCTPFLKCLAASRRVAQRWLQYAHANTRFTTASSLRVAWAKKWWSRKAAWLLYGGRLHWRQAQPSCSGWSCLSERSHFSSNGWSPTLQKLLLVSLCCVCLAYEQVNFSCPECLKCFKSNAALKSHITTHAG